ncbi:MULTISPECIES: tetratricopeptide repeat protein [unclassified Microcoleus]|uniref:tetratricopeptide repeat protein n=1 Tax=unclassified Microcoleus TaxID=2642155 RepID=UPI002FD11839
MTISDVEITSDLDCAIARYEVAVRAIEKASNPQPEEVLEVLAARDVLSATLGRTPQPAPESLITVLQLDDRLKEQAESINETANLGKWRRSFNPPQAAWWWYIDELQSPSKQWDWVWQLLSVACLVTTTSFISSIQPRFGAGGVGIAEAFGMLSQSGLTLLVAGGSFTKGGQEFVERLLKNLKIPLKYQSEVTTGLSAIMLLSAIALNASLPVLAKYYSQNGQKNLAQGQLEQAGHNLDQAIALDPENADFYLHRGEVYEAMLKLDDARTSYQTALAGNNYKAFNNLGRVAFLKQDYTLAEAMFRIGLENIQTEQLKYKLHKNLGWTLLQKKSYPEAIDHLKIAIALDEKQQPENREGLTHCILFEVLEAAKSDTASLETEKQKCDENSEKFANSREFDWYTHTLQRFGAIKGDPKQPQPAQKP